MSTHKNINTKIDPAGGDTTDRGNAVPVLQEIRHALRNLLETGESRVLDLRAIPFGPADESRLLSMLGRGEVSATLDALGESRIWESQYPGVWIVEHRNNEGERIAFQIEITTAPAILLAQRQDMASAVKRLDQLLSKTRSLNSPGDVES